MKRTWMISYQDRLWLCFMAGVVVGTVIANLLGRELQSQIGYFDTLFSAGTALDRQERQQLWWFVARQRGMELIVAWLVSLTVFSAAGYYLIAGFAGGSLAVAVVVITLQKGILGLPFYVATVMPQAFCYVPVCLVLAAWAGEDSRKMHLGALGILLALTLAGAVSEVYINPWLLGFLKNL